jgi:hypothetical protein
MVRVRLTRSEVRNAKRVSREKEIIYNRCEIPGKIVRVDPVIKNRRNTESIYEKQSKIKELQVDIKRLKATKKGSTFLSIEKKSLQKKYPKLCEEKIIYKFLKKTELVDEEELSILCKCDLIDIL